MQNIKTESGIDTTLSFSFCSEQLVRKMTEYLCSASRHLPASQAIASLTHPQAPASAGDVSSAKPRQKKRTRPCLQ